MRGNILNKTNKTSFIINKQDEEMFKLSEDLRIVEKSRLFSKGISKEEAFIHWNNICNDNESCHKNH